LPLVVVLSVDAAVGANDGGGHSFRGCDVDRRANSKDRRADTGKSNGSLAAFAKAHHRLAVPTNDAMQ
jgi:hypothetical protein